MPATITTTFHLVAITDESISKTHLGAKERANRTWCGVSLLVADDPRFGGRYAGIVYTSSTDLETVTCGACKRSAAWKIHSATGSATVGVRAPKPKAAPEAEAVPGQAKPPPTRKRPSAANRGAAKTAAKAAAEAVSGSSVVEADPETGLPRIKPEVQAKADKITADQLARNAEAGGK